MEMDLEGEWEDNMNLRLHPKAPGRLDTEMAPSTGPECGVAGEGK